MLHRLSLAAAASVAALGLASVAGAVTVTDENATAEIDALDIGNRIQIQDNDLLGVLDFATDIEIADVPGVRVTYDVRDSDGVDRGIENLVLSVTLMDGTELNYQLTDANGVEIMASGFVFPAVQGIANVALSGTGFGSAFAPAEFDIVFEAVPVPGAAILFGTALAGGIAARRKRKLA